VVLGPESNCPLTTGIVAQFFYGEAGRAVNVPSDDLANGFDSCRQRLSRE
jgi:hypothetical protein